MRGFAGLISDPFFMDVEATLRTDMSGKLSFDTAANTVQFRDVLSIVVELPFAPIIEAFHGATLIGVISENVVTRRGKPIRLERLGRPEIKNVLMANPSRDPRAKRRRATRSVQSRRRLCAVPGISTTLRVASGREPGGLR